MRILVIGINYAPERSGIAPFTTGLCDHLASQGHQVKVVTTFPYYPEWRVWDDYRGGFYKKESLNGVLVHRVWQFVPSRPSRLLQRMLYYASFAVTSFVAALFTGECDIILCLCPPIEAALGAFALSKIKGSRYVIKLNDLATDAALATGILREGFLIRLARSLERFTYQQAEAVICLCPGFVDKLTSQGISSEKMHLIPDWSDVENIGTDEQEDGFRRATGLLPQQFLVFHTGNMGKKQDLMNIVRAAELSRKDPDLVWVLVGQGEERPVLASEISRLGLTNVRLLPFQSAANLSKMYASSEVLLLNQKASVEDAVSPSKLLTYMAARRPVVAAVSAKSEAARQIGRANCGLLVPAEDPAALAAAVRTLRREPALRAQLGSNGRRYAEEHFARSTVLQAYDELLGNLIPHRNPQFARKEVAPEADLSPTFRRNAE
jgi:colanic acid biosynthesis glycosyl transferase WcaI